MPKGYRPTIFVSSTCYDLNQVRVDLKQFIESIGLDPVMSEFDCFPVNPNHNNITNCLENVKNRADILVLIVGARHGSLTETGKSITNLEYLEAKAKGIPIYIFIHKTIKTILPIWEKNKDGDYSESVDTTKLFDFVVSLRENKDKWVYSFETAQEITTTLKKQLAFLFMEALEIKKKFSTQTLEIDCLDLSPKCLEIVMTKPEGWEYRLFVQLLKDGIANNQDKRNDIDYRVSFGQSIKLVDTEDINQWIQRKLDEIAKAIQSITRLMNEGLSKAFGKPGVAGDLAHIIYATKRIIEGYCRLLDWSLEFNRVTTDKDFEKLISLVSAMAMNAIKEIEEYSVKVYKEINYTFDNLDKFPKGTKIELTLTVTVPDPTELNLELERIVKKYSN